MNKKFEPFLSHSELTDCIYIIDKDDKYEVTEQCIKAMKATNRMPKWIPVSEREPDEDYETNGIQYSDDVLVTLKRKRPVNDEGIVDFARTNDGKWFSQLSRIYIPDDWEVVAWMPLPEPYKAESEGEG